MNPKNFNQYTLTPIRLLKAKKNKYNLSDLLAVEVSGFDGLFAYTTIPVNVWKDREKLQEFLQKLIREVEA